MSMRVAIFDTETTSLIQNIAQRIDKQPQIVEIFIIEAEHFDVTTLGASEREWEVTERGTFYSRFKPKMRMAPDASAATGIYDKDLVNEPVFSYHVQTLRRIFEGCDRVVGHNLSFDKTMVDLELERLGLDRMKWPELFCTVEATVYMTGRRLSLNSDKYLGLHEYLTGEKFEKAHTAEADARATFRCYRALVKRGLA